MNFIKSSLYIFSPEHQKSRQKTETIFEQLNLLELSFMTLSFEGWWKHIKVNLFQSAQTLLLR